MIDGRHLKLERIIEHIEYKIIIVFLDEQIYDQYEDDLNCNCDNEAYDSQLKGSEFEYFHCSDDHRDCDDIADDPVFVGVPPCEAYTQGDGCTYYIHNTHTVLSKFK